ncbi:hypothetical protein [Nitrosospira sp. Nsp1]|uniref:hypothetical protein n=1 Tax=Nitrosospira sp. Nsp1 TaxID=136547 RepID=UPI000B876025|nr:hypothetical protein [Nitrosospira sp. Nsp1]
MKPKLFLHLKQAHHFVAWEREHFRQYFDLVDSPSQDAIVLSFGPDVIHSGARLPASKRFAYILPGFGSNPVYNLELRNEIRGILIEYYDSFFINPGPLEIAYGDLKNICICPFSLNTSLVGFSKYRKEIESLLHISHDSPQKDWQRSQSIMKKTGLRNEVFPSREAISNQLGFKWKKRINHLVKKLTTKNFFNMPPGPGYVMHEEVIKKYHMYDAFIHVARDIKDPIYIDGKYTASLLEAGLTGAILFWHDTFQTGKNLETVFDLPLDIEEAARIILEVRESINVEKHSQKTQEEILDVCRPEHSVSIRCQHILGL